MRLAFLGTPEFALPTLAALVEAGHDLVAVYAQPPAPRGRGRRVRPSPVQAFAEAGGLPVRTPTSLREAEEIALFGSLRLDAAVVVAFGQILPAEILVAPLMGAFNLHASLLPRWRGAAPIQRAVMAGDTSTGVTVMRMTEGLDEGPVLASVAVPILASDTSGVLLERLARTGAPLIVATLAAAERGDAAEIEQTDEGITYARKIRRRETRLRWTLAAEAIDRTIRGLSPRPGAWFSVPTPAGPVRVKALLSSVEAEMGEPGQVLDDALLIACGERSVRILRAQREGRAPQDAAAFLRGFSLTPGTRLS